MLMFDEWFNFENKLSLSDQYNLAKALFDHLPNTSQEGDIRVVAVGGFFESGTNLVFVIKKVLLKKGAVPGHDYALLILTNSFKFKTENKETGKITLSASDSYMSTEISYSRLLVPYDGGELVVAGNLNIEDKQPEAAKTLTDLGNLMDTYLKDGRPENDGLVEKLYSHIKDEASPGSMEAFLGVMNYALYKLMNGNHKEARQHFDEASSRFLKMRMNRCPMRLIMMRFFSAR